MKNITLKFQNTKNAFTALTAVLILLTIGLACNFEMGKPEMPSDAEINSLIKQTTSDFADAVQKEDFSDFMQTTSKDFQNQFTNDKLKNAFAVFIDKKDIVVPLLKKAAGTNPTYSTPPSISQENNVYLLNTEGEFPGGATPVKFQISYERDNGKWKLLKVFYKL